MFDWMRQIWLQVRQDTSQDTADPASGTTGYKPGFNKSSLRFDRIQARIHSKSTFRFDRILSRIQQIKPPGTTGYSKFGFRYDKDTYQDTQQFKHQVRQDSSQDTADPSSVSIGYSKFGFRYDKNTYQDTQQIKHQVRQDSSQVTQQIKLQVQQDTVKLQVS